MIEQRRSFTNLRHDLSDGNVLADVENKLIDDQRIADFIRRNKPLVVGAGIILAGPYIYGAAQGLGPKETAIYGTLRLLTLGAGERPESQFINEFVTAIENRDVAEVGSDLQHIGGLIEDAYINHLDQGLVVGIAGAVLYKLSRGREIQRSEVSEGRKPLHPKGEQMVVLGGKSSYVADVLATSPYRRSIITTLETAEGAEHILAQNAREVRNLRGVYLNLNIHESGGLSYLKTPEWERLHLRKQNLIHAKNGKRYLMVVGCGEGADNELSFDPAHVDVSQDDLRSSVLRLKNRLHQGDLVEERDIIDVYIGNGALEWDDIERPGQKITDREVAKLTGVDIYVDTWSLILNELAERLQVIQASNVKLATTTRVEERFREEFANHIRNVPGCENITFDQNSNGDSVWLVFQEKSEQTFMAARRMRKMYPHRKIMALISSNNIEEYVQTGGCEDVEFVTISNIIAEKLLDIRTFLREGYTPGEIQAYLDEHLTQKASEEPETASALPLYEGEAYHF